MEHKNKLAVLALLEAYRLLADDKKEQNADHAIRVCQAIIAKVLGFDGRNSWTSEIHVAGLIDYRHDVDKAEQYKKLTNLVNDSVTDWNQA